MPFHFPSWQQWWEIKACNPKESADKESFLNETNLPYLLCCFSMKSTELLFPAQTYLINIRPLVDDARFILNKSWFWKQRASSVTWISTCMFFCLPLRRPAKECYFEFITISQWGYSDCNLKAFWLRGKTTSSEKCITLCCHTTERVMSRFDSLHIPQKQIPKCKLPQQQKQVYLMPGDIDKYLGVGPGPV